MTITDLTKKTTTSYDRKNPFSAKILSCTKLNKEGSTKKNLHVVIDLSGSDISYTPGGSFGLLPENQERFIYEILDLLGVDANHKITDSRQGDTLSIFSFLQKRSNLGRVTSKHLELAKDTPKANDILTCREKLRAYAESNDLFTFLREFWTKEIDLQKLCDIMCPLLPRFYSIASSQLKVGNHLHLMVASFSYELQGREKMSITAEHLQTQDSIKLFYQPNKHFGLPKDPTTPIIMVGPGTGIAAFCGFLQERSMQKSTNSCWLFTGDRQKKYDFHYEEELKNYQNAGFLKLNTAFSRDGDKKVYVQDSMWEERHLLWEWIEKQNALIYISGDAKHMAKDVQATLIKIAINQGNHTEESAKEFWKKQRKEHKLLLDVY